MNDIEQQVRNELTHAVQATPPLPGLADRVIHSGRRRRRLRAAAATGTVLAAVAFAGVQLVPAVGDRGLTGPAAPAGPPTVPIVVAQGTTEILDWSTGTMRSRPLGEALPIAAVPAGLLLATGGPAPDLALLGPDATTARTLVRGLATSSVAVSHDGNRVTIVSGTGTQRRLRELELPSARELRSVIIGPPLATADEPVQPVGYSAGTVLLTLGEGSTQRTALWEAGDDQVVGTLDGFTSALGGAPTDGDANGSSPGGRAAFTVADDRCRTAIADLRTGAPAWSLCREHFVGFSPDGQAVLSTDATGDALIVHDADDGDTERVLRVPNGLRAYGWESADTIIYTTVDGNATVVIRCATESGRCHTVATIPGVDRIPQPVTRYGD